jgi:ubiquinone/menaquinone biosynthesis C-methylase UbiE
MDKCISILDTGAGSGNLTVELAKKGKKVVAIDSEPYSLKLLKNKVEQSSQNIDIIEGNVGKLPFLDNEFDGVTSMFLVPFVDDNEKYFSEVYRVLKSKGVFSASIWAPIQKAEQNWNLRDAVEHKFTEMGLLPKYQKEWDELLYTSKINAKNIDSKNLDDTEIKNIMENIGFLDIVIDSDIAYNGYAYFLTARK